MCLSCDSHHDPPVCVCIFRLIVCFLGFSTEDARVSQKKVHVFLL